MEIKKMNLNELKPANYNPRVDLDEHDEEYQKIKNSIEHFGYVDPIIWNKRTNTIVGGHQRLKVVKSLGWETIDVSVVDLSLEDEKALNIALNKIEGDWEQDKLKDLLLDLDDDALELTGFDDDEIYHIVNEVNIDGLFEEDEQQEENDNDEGPGKLDRAIELLKLTHDKLINSNQNYTNTDLYDSVEFFLEDE